MTSRALEVSTEDQRCLPPVADGLLRWRGASLLAAKDVLIWRQGKTVRISFRGPALAIERQVYARDMLPNRHYETDIELQHALGFEAEPWRDGHRIIGVKGTLGQQLDEGETQYAELLRVVGQSAGYALARCLGGDPEEPEVVEANLMPLEGAPLFPHYSAKKKRWLPAGKPPATVELDITKRDDAGREYTERVTAADVCTIYPHVTGCSRDIVAIMPLARGGSGSAWRVASGGWQPGDTHVFFDTSRRAYGDFMVVHATMPTPESAKLVKKCGGWLFPSMGVGMVPSVTFGPLVLVAGVDLVLKGLRPYRTGQGVWPINIYDSDVWTMRSSDIAKGARILYEQLTGIYDEDDASIYGAMGAHGAHQWILGAPTSFAGPTSELVEPKILTSTKALHTELAKRWSIWKYTDDPASSAGILDRYGLTKHRYPYIEAKANSLVDLSCWQVAVCPKSWANKSRAYLRATGAPQPPLLVVPDPPSAAKHGTEYWGLHGVDSDVVETHGYARAVAEAVVAFAQREGRIRAYTP